MSVTISRQLAQQIVDTIHDICNYNINFIHPDGTILASSNSGRIGTFHEIGKKAAASGQTIEVSSDEDYSGTKKGINIPIYHRQSVLAVIGITADPAEGRKYAHLAERITALLLHEQELFEYSRNIDEQKLYVIRSLQNGDFDNRDYLRECLKQFHVNERLSHRMVCIQINTKCNPLNLSMLTQQVQALFGSMHQEVHAFLYPNQFAALISDAAFRQNDAMLRKFAAEHHPILKTAIGGLRPLYLCGESWDNAQVALSSIEKKKETNFVLYDEMKLELLLSGMNKDRKAEFRKMILKELDEKDLAFLFAYYETDMSLTQTAKIFFLHKNTVQQKLNRIYEKTGLNPRKFRDAVLLYLGMQE